MLKERNMYLAHLTKVKEIKNPLSLAKTYDEFPTRHVDPFASPVPCQKKNSAIFNSPTNVYKAIFSHTARHFQEQSNAIHLHI